MSEDDIDGLIVDVVEWLEKLQPVDFDDDTLYNEFCSLFYSALEIHCTKERNYN